MAAINDEQVYYNQAGSYMFDIRGPRKSSLFLEFPPSFSDFYESLELKLDNLFYEGQEGEYSINHKYRFGDNGEQKLQIVIHAWPQTDSYWGKLVLRNKSFHLAKSHDSRVEAVPAPPNRPANQDPGYVFYQRVNNLLQAEAARQEASRAAARARGRNVAALKQTLLAPMTAQTPANWYAGPQRAVPNLPVGANAYLASFLSGEAGNIAAQQQASKAKAGVPGARRRKTRRRKN